MQQLVRNKVKDFATWHASFNEDSAAADDVDRANAFMARPESQKMSVKSGVINGEFHYLEAVASD